MTKGEITIDEDVCKGCGYCALFCRRSCISIPGDRFTPQGYFLPLFSSPELCNACGICGWMCPHFAIQVYKMPEAGHEIKTINSEKSE
ncbi:MAG: 4Fe-4S binding protein [Candidatus Tectomicrobia bacterium]|uniref:4Fe-4S binding protein n=1 Tax=Tectimicrobiota bacterium TaxID=2528274 RepID=A0A933GL94_UNCTE|nr:4Fe-4S binding protein [Candidatus Tectomicrobia bacterium]